MPVNARVVEGWAVAPTPGVTVKVLLSTIDATYAGVPNLSALPVEAEIPVPVVTVTCVTAKVRVVLAWVVTPVPVVTVIWLPGPTEVISSPAGNPLPLTGIPTIRPVVAGTPTTLLPAVVLEPDKTTGVEGTMDAMNSPAGTAGPNTAMPTDRPAVEATGIMLLPAVVVPVVETGLGIPVPVTTIPTVRPSVEGTVIVAPAAAVTAFVKERFGVSTSDPVPLLVTVPDEEMGAVMISPSGERPEVVITGEAADKTSALPEMVGVVLRLSLLDVIAFAAVRVN